MASRGKLRCVLREPEVPVRPTVATILREYKLVESRDVAERQELEALMCGGLSPENYQYWRERRRQEEEHQLRQTLEQRKLEARLTSSRIQERARRKFEENQRRAQQFKEYEMKLKEELAERSAEGLGKARERVDKVILEEFMSRLAVANKRKEKEQNAQLVKVETMQKIEEGRKLKEKEREERMKKIQKIQAASLVNHRIREKYSRYELKEPNFSCQMSDSEAQFRLYLGKCEESAEAVSRKERVRAEKEAQRERIEAAKRKINSHRQLVQELAKYKR